MKKIILSLIALCSITIMWSQTTTNIQPTYNGYINQGNPTTALIQNPWELQVKTQTGFSRYGYLEFPLANIDPSASTITFKIYLSGPLMTDFPTTAVLNGSGLTLLVNSINYAFDNTLTWNNQTVPNSSNETSVVSVPMSDALKDTYIAVDITTLAKTMKAAGNIYIRFRLSTQGGNGELLRFRQMEMSGSTVLGIGAYYPRLVQVTSVSTGLNEISTQNSILYPTISSDRIMIKGITARVFDVKGKLVLNEIIKNGILNIYSLETGMYFVKTESGSGRFIKQ